MTKELEMKMKKMMITMAMASVIVGCEVTTESESDVVLTDDSDTSISTMNLEGEVGGRSWTFVSGRARPSGYSDGTYSLAFWNEDVEQPCDQFEMGSEDKLLGSFPISLGTYDLSFTKTINFNSDLDNNVTTDGRLVITEVTEDKVYGKMVASFDDENYVNGLFELTLCE